MDKLFTNFRWWHDDKPGSMHVRDGKVIARGEAVSNFDAKLIDLNGSVVMPSFIDAHCHVLPTGLDLKKLHLGHCNSRDDVLASVADWSRSHADDNWIHAVHYDQTKFEDGEHITRYEIDHVVADRPVLLRHVNGHASVANTAALAASNVNRGTPDPQGGEFVRDASGELTGVLLERAHEFVTNATPHPTQEEMTLAILAAGDRMCELGIGCASDMMTGRWNLRDELLAYADAASRGCKVRLRLYIQWGAVLGSRGIDASDLAELIAQMPKENCDVRGLKIFADGAIGSATAAIYGRFLTTGKSGQLIYDPDRLKEMVRRGHEGGWSIAIHSIGDRSTDVVLDAFEATGEPQRHRLEHAMLLSDAQIDRLREAGCHTTMQPEFLMRFGHAYKRQLGLERASGIKRCRSVFDAGISLSFSSDRPIVNGDPWDGIRSAVNRPEGFDSRENMSAKDAMLCYTKGGAIANRDDEVMGELNPGQFADFQTFESNPANGLGAIRIATYKNGEEI